MSPPLVVAYALAGTINHDFATQPIGYDHARQPVFLDDIWPTQQEVADTVLASIGADMFRHQYSTVSDGDQNWQNLSFPPGDTYGWEPDSTYIRKAPYFDGMPATPRPSKTSAAPAASPSWETPSPPTTSPPPAPSS